MRSWTISPGHEWLWCRKSGTYFLEHLQIKMLLQLLRGPVWSRLKCGWGMFFLFYAIVFIPKNLFQLLAVTWIGFEFIQFWISKDLVPILNTPWRPNIMLCFIYTRIMGWLPMSEWQVNVYFLGSWLCYIVLVVYGCFGRICFQINVLYICKYIALKENYSGKSKGTAGGGWRKSKIRLKMAFEQGARSCVSKREDPRKWSRCG